MKSYKNKIKIPFEVISLIFKYSPSYFVFFIPQVIFSAFLPLLYVYAPKFIIEALTEGKDYYDIFRIITIFCGIALLLNIITCYLNVKITYCTEKFSRKLSAEIGETVMNLSLSELECTTERDNIRLAGDAAGTIELCEIIRKIIQNFITLIGLVSIICKLNIDFLFILIVLLIVKIIFTYINYKKNIELRRLSAQNDRTGNYLTNLCYFNQGAAKEIRVNCIQSWFLIKVKNFRQKMVKLQYKEFRRNLIFDSINAILFAISSFFILWILSVYYLDNVISIADFTLYFTTISTLNTTLWRITDLIAQYHKQLEKAADYKNLKKLTEKNKENSLSNKIFCTPPSTIEICFSNVWFAYPGSKDYVLRDINIIIKNREKLVVVGYNGAGKSTFIKLLCKFYYPTKGKITLNGVNIWDIPNEQYNKIIGAVFQDFVTFAFTISENISMSENNDDDLSDIISRADLADFINKLPSRTPHAKIF